MTQTPTQACAWYQYRFNIMPFGEIGVQQPTRFADSLTDALRQRKDLESIGAEDVRVYDTVDGLFY